MIKEVNKACEKLNDTLGISVELPQFVNIIDFFD